MSLWNLPESGTLTNPYYISNSDDDCCIIENNSAENDKNNNRGESYACLKVVEAEEKYNTSTDESDDNLPGFLQKDFCTVKNRRASVCVRIGCPNKAVENPEWDYEFCSSACAISYFRTVFQDWIAARKAEKYV